MVRSSTWKSRPTIRSLAALTSDRFPAPAMSAALPVVSAAEKRRANPPNAAFAIRYATNLFGVSCSTQKSGVMPSPPKTLRPASVSLASPLRASSQVLRSLGAT